MGLHLGNSGIKKVYLGNNEVSKIYLGPDLVYKSELSNGISIDVASNGVYVLGTDNLLYTSEFWNSYWNEEAVGIALITDNTRFVIDPEQNENYLPWSKGDAEDLVSGVTTTTNFSVARADYKGLENTLAIVTKYGNTLDYAAGWCNNRLLKNNKKGYLGSYGEWDEVAKNKIEIDEYMEMIGGIPVATANIYWTSTQYNKYSAFTNDGSTNKGNDYLIRAFAKL